MDASIPALNILSESKETKQLYEKINEPRILSTYEKTFSYGETPTTVCRRHFEEMALFFNIPAEKLAADVIEGSLANKLEKLTHYYKSKDEDAGILFDSLTKQMYEPQNTKTGHDNFITTNEIKTQKRVRTTHSPQKVSKQVSSKSVKSASHLYDAVQNLSILNTSTINPLSIKPGSSSSTSMVNPTSNQTCLNVPDDPILNSVSHSVDRSHKSVKLTATDILNKITSDSELETPVQVSTIAVEKKETTAELEAFLFGDLPYVARTPPRKKLKKQPGIGPDSISELPTGSEGSPASTVNVSPALTFNAFQWSPSRQRDLLSIAKDLSKLQRSIKSGDLPKKPLSELIAFTKPSDDTQ